MYVREISNLIYSKRDLAEARQAFAKFLDVKVVPVSYGRVSLSVGVLSAFQNQEREIVLEFFNYLLDAAIQRRMSEMANG